MVCYSHSNSRLQQGRGMMDSLLRPFIVSKYGNVMHSRSLDPNHFLQGYTFNGPKTEILLRERSGDNKALNDLNKTTKEHDYTYLQKKNRNMKMIVINRNILIIFIEPNLYLSKKQRIVEMTR